ncbi:IclR family transcriptional regulator [Brevibacillus sp. SYSU BS000544]|uniref:IclR family transcriptional regulator n=1 Tax=Brevibacillus sp. SYSU BS000544 TaxID=3416443 RepID=UPI003CE59942
MVQSIDRAIQIINVLVSDDNKSGWSISDLAEATSLPLGTLHRILQTLIKHALVIQDPESKQYKPGYKWVEMGLKMIDKIDFRKEARPVMERLAMEVEESIYLNMPQGLDAIVIEKIDSPLKLRISENLGIRIPINIGAPNKTILAHMKDQEIKQVLNQLNLSPEEQQGLWKQLSEIRMNHYAVSYGEITEGTACVAAPIIGHHGKVLAAISINLPSSRLHEQRLPILIEKVKEAAVEITNKLGVTSYGL